MSSLTIAVTHAIAFLTRPLVGKYSPIVIDRLHTALESQLTAAFRPSWVDTDPSQGAQSRVLSFSQGSLPPAPVWRAGIAAGIQWSDWFAEFEVSAFDLFVDPGCVAFQVAPSLGGYYQLVWREMPIPAGFGPVKRKTLAQSIEDDEENTIFSLIDSELSAPWLTPIFEQFPNVPPVTIMSRPSSRSSNSSGSIFSFGSSDAPDSASSYSSPSSCRSSLDLPRVSSSGASIASSECSQKSRRSRRARPRVPEVFIDSNRKDVTNYDGGKTTVLTGGVMLGAPKPPAPKAAVTMIPTQAPVNNNWRRSVFTSRR